MTWAEWKFSARLGSQDRFIRWTALATAVVLVGMSAFFLWRLLPEGWRSGVVTLHYNVYLGIDDVRPWPWLFTLPGIAAVVTVVDVLCSLGLYRQNPLASRTIMATGFITTALWAIGSFFLILVNV